MCGKRHDLEAASIAIRAGLECHACLARTSKALQQDVHVPEATPRCGQVAG